MERKIEFKKLLEDEKEIFIKDIQKAFNIAVIEEFGEDEGEAIPREDVINSFNEKGAESYFIFADGEYVGGTVLVIDSETLHNELSLLYINADFAGKGIGSEVWKAIEKLHPETKVWETFTPYFEKRNINFYVNKCGFHIIEFFNEHHCDPNNDTSAPGTELMFRFEKRMG